MLLPFELDPQIIHHIIYSQAGSIGKAIIELLMNSVDASATSVQLSISREGFTCRDDGNGFACRDDVLRYFGRFGTPHQEGDATYGRFRLGRGQIMAHASTVWQSHDWQMTVDTRVMGYSYELDNLPESVTGCRITGVWYEPLSDAEYMSAVQEIRDLVRYTPISVELNGRIITRDPSAEKWDFEDEFAYYRAREDGAVSIYNQGVLVRHDPAHLWGAGGLIVSKQALGLNVSRTEILRKTCPVWKAIAKQFGKMAEAINARLGEHRKTEARREKSARALLCGDPKMMEIFRREEVITILPGKRHVSLNDFLRKAHSHGGTIAVIEDGFDVPKGEAIARLNKIQLVHPQTLDRFGCYGPEDFRESLERITDHLQADIEQRGVREWGQEWMHAPALAAFSVLRDAFVERMQIVSEKDVLDKETRRAWIALRWCLQQYAGACAGGRMYSDGRLHWDDEHRMSILLGDSNSAEAWTDGKSYIAITVEIVQRLKTEPLKAAAYIFGLIEHEIAHQGDSLDCGHDEAFYQRYHDISIRMSPERQRYIHMWMMKYTTSMESEGKKAVGRAWSERYLVDRAGSGREKRGLPRMIDDVSSDPIVTAEVPEENMALIKFMNAGLVVSGACPPAPEWSEVLDCARVAWQESVDQRRKIVAQQVAEEALMDAQIQEETDLERARLATILGIDVADLHEAAFSYLCGMSSDDHIREAWADKAWEWQDDCDWDPDPEQIAPCMDQTIPEEAVDLLGGLDSACRDLVYEGETLWQLERNAAAAGFFRVENYLKWRASAATECA
jgi:hypothetical protein